MPITPSVMPIGTSTFGPNRGTKRLVPSWAASTSIPIIGRKESPVWIGEYPSVSCR